MLKALEQGLALAAVRETFSATEVADLLLDIALELDQLPSDDLFDELTEPVPAH